jgi:hypothetical protein
MKRPRIFAKEIKKMHRDRNIVEPKQQRDFAAEGKYSKHQFVLVSACVKALFDHEQSFDKSVPINGVFENSTCISAKNTRRAIEIVRG